MRTKDGLADRIDRNTYIIVGFMTIVNFDEDADVLEDLDGEKVLYFEDQENGLRKEIPQRH